MPFPGSLRRFRRPLLVLAGLAGVGGGISCLVGPSPPPMAAPAAPGSAPYRVAVVSDTQRMPVVEWVTPGGPRERGRVREEIRRQRPDFVILVGDAVGAGCCRSSWSEFRREYHSLSVWPVLGNHDLFGPDRRCLRNYCEAFPHVGGRRWYALIHPPVEFLLLDSNFKGLSKEEAAAQDSWVEAELERAQGDPAVRAVVIVAHHPPFSAHFSGGDEEVRRRFWEPAARRSKFVAFFSGHHHNYQHVRVGSRHAFVSGGGGAPLLWREGAGLPREAELVAARGAHHLLILDVGAGGLEVSMHELQAGDRWEVRDGTSIAWPGGAGGPSR